MIYFTPEEVRCKCGRPECDARTDLDSSFGRLLDDLRAHLGYPVDLTSALRCEYWNTREGGEAKGGSHVRGYAADIAVNGSRERFKILRAVFGSRVFHRVGVGKTFIHLDIDPTLDQDVMWLYP